MWCVYERNLWNTCQEGKILLFNEKSSPGKMFGEVFLVFCKEKKIEEKVC